MARGDHAVALYQRTNPVGTAGSLTLLVQALLPVRCALRRRGYYPRGGGDIELATVPARPSGRRFVAAASPRAILGRAHTDHLPRHVATRMSDAVRAPLPRQPFEIEAEVAAESANPGGSIVLWTGDGSSVLGAAVSRERDGLPLWSVNRVMSRILLFPATGADPTETVLRRGRVVEIDPPLEKGAHLAGQYLVRLALPGEPRLVTRSVYGLHQADYAVSPTPLRLEDFDRAERGLVRRRRHLLTGNLYAALQLATRENLGRPQLFTDAEGQRQRGVLLHADYTLTELRDQPVLLRGSAVLAACVAHALQNPPKPITVLIAQTDGGGHPLQFDRRRDFVLEVEADAVRLSIPGAHARNAVLLHSQAWRALPLAGEPLAGDRTVMTMRIEPADRAAVLAVLGETFAWYAPAKYRDWYNTQHEPSATHRPESAVARGEPARAAPPPRP